MSAAPAAFLSRIIQQTRLAIIGRALTLTEEELVRSLFQTSLDTHRVRLYRRSYLPFFVGASMSPNGNIYFPAPAYEDDFAKASLHARCHFVHEMTHVWQHQLRYNLRWQGLKVLLSGGYWQSKIYRYEQERARPFSQYNFEQQAQLIEHYYHMSQSQSHRPIVQEAVAEFLRNPNNRALLPRKAAAI